MRGIFCLLCALLSACASARAQQWDWVQRFSGDSVGTAIGVDANQNVYVAGRFAGTNYFGTNRFVSMDGNDTFLLKMNSDGEMAWTMTLGGYIGHILISTNGALFVCGSFTIPRSLFGASVTNTSDAVSNVFLARVDDRRFTWFQSGGFASRINFGPDESLWLARYKGLLFTAHYSQEGQLLRERSFDTTGLPAGRAVSDSNGDAFLSTIFGGQLVIGTNTLDPNYSFAQLTVGLDAEEGVRWFWSASLGYNSVAEDIAMAPDGRVISIGYVEQWLPRRIAFISKHSSDGTLLWRKDRSGGCTKNFWTPTAVSFDASGNVLVAGGCNVCPSSPRDRALLWMLTLDANGNTLSEEFFNTSANVVGLAPTLAIAGDADGAVYLTGRAPGDFTFGTNVSVGGANAFILRRSTLHPRLTSEQMGTELILSWPRAAVPFALQRRDETGTNWSFVSEAPVLVNGRWRVTLATEINTDAFRLFRTNEAPIRHMPRWLTLYGPLGSFLDHQNAIIENARLAFTGDCQDLDDETLTFTWADTETGEIIVGNASATHSSAHVDPGGNWYTPIDRASLAQDATTYGAGVHTIQVVASDGVFSVTNYSRFEVIGKEKALEEFFAAIEPLRSDRAGRRALAFLDAYRRVKEKGHDKLAGKRWTRFQRQLQRVTSLSEEERGKLASAAEQVTALL